MPPGDADGSGAARVATPRTLFSMRAHTGGQRMRAWHLLAGSPSLSGLSCQQTQRARISTGVPRHASRGGRQAWESALCFTAVSQAQRRSACLRTRRGLAGDECGLQQRTYRSGWPRVGSLRHRPRRRHRNRSAPLSRRHLRRRSQRCSPSSLQCILDRWWVRAATLYLLRAR